jgi:hypothetical protein
MYCMNVLLVTSQDIHQQHHVSSLCVADASLARGMSHGFTVDYCQPSHHYYILILYVLRERLGYRPATGLITSTS